MNHAYPKQLLDNTYLHNEAEDIYHSGFILKEQVEKIKAELPALRSQRNILVRLSLFLLGFLLLNACYGFVALIIAQALSYSEFGWRTLLLVNSVIAFVALENVIRNRDYFRFGVDDAFLFSAILMLLIFVSSLNDFSDIKLVCFTAIVAGAFCSYRYIDGLSALIACAGTTGLIVIFCIQLGGIAQMMLPFVLMANAGLLYFFYLKLKARNESATWHYCLEAVYGYCIVLFYLSGNYMVVREGTVVLLKAPIAPGGDIPMAWIFYMFTIGVPLAYIFYALKKKNRMLLQFGILFILFGVYSIRFYHRVLPPEWGLIIAGGLVFVIAYFSILKLKHKTSGINFMPDRFTDQSNILDAEAVAIAQTFGAKAHEPVKQTEFGGGEFGGGGASGKF